MPYVHPREPQVDTSYARVFPSPEIAGNLTRPVLVITVLSRSVAAGPEAPVALRRSKTPPAINTSNAAAAIPSVVLDRILLEPTAGPEVSSACANSPAVLKRSAGTFANAFSTAR